MGYSLILAFLIKLGLSFYISAALIKSLLIISSILLWNKFICFFITDKNIRLISITLVSCFTIIVSISVTDLILMCIYPFFILVFFNTFSYRLKSIITGLVAGLAISFKYTSIPLILIGLYISIFPINTSNLKISTYQKLKNIILFSLFCNIITLPLFINNYINSKSFSTVTNIIINIQGIKLSWIYDSLRTLLIDAFYFPKVILREFNILPNSYFENIILLLLSSLLIYSLLYSFSSKVNKLQKLSQVLIISYLSTVIFLGFTTFLYYYDSMWNPLQHGRYYQWFVPAIFLNIVVSLYYMHYKYSINLNKYYHDIIINIILILIILCAFAFQYHLYKITQIINYNEKVTYDYVNKLKKKNDIDEVIVFADSDNFRANPRINNFIVYPSKFELNNNIFVTKKTLIVLICSNSGNWGEYKKINYCDEMDFVEAANKNKFIFENNLLKNNLYWKIYSKGYLINQ